HHTIVVLVRNLLFPPSERDNRYTTETASTRQNKILVDLKVKVEPTSPEPCPAEDQTEPVDLSLNKPRLSAVPPSTTIATLNPPPGGSKQTSPLLSPPQVLSPGSILATQGAGGQQILHVIHTIPSVSMPSKVGQLQTIPVVVQSLPVVYTTMPTDGVATAAITVPLIGSDGRSEGSGEPRPRHRNVNPDARLH
uniref:Uncharacterized protein n=1 Tax=Mola mola TaxID=94237 RepID=A0A3Q4BHY5_MOLML